MTSSNGKKFRVTGHTKVSDAELWFFFFICAWITGWINNDEAGDLRCHRAQYETTVMCLAKTKPINTLMMCTSSEENWMCYIHMLICVKTHCPQTLQCVTVYSWQKFVDIPPPLWFLVSTILLVTFTKILSVHSFCRKPYTMPLNDTTIRHAQLQYVVRITVTSWELLGVSSHR